MNANFNLDHILNVIFSNTIVAFILLIGIVIFVHELGHFLAGILFKIQVEEFSIGFGPAAFTIKKGPTQYRINWLPLGGYVRFYGADLEENIPLKDQEKSFLHAKLYKRAIVSFAGPFANFVLSFFIMLGLLWHGLPTQPTNVTVIPHSVAAQAGLQTGDKILSINHSQMENWPELVKKISHSAGETLVVEVERNGKTLTFPVTPPEVSTSNIYGTKEKSGRIGITPIFSIAYIVPKKNDFFDLFGLKLGDKINSVNGKKISYSYEFFNLLKSFLHSDSNAILAKNILSSKISEPLELSVTRGGQEILLKTDFSSAIWKDWAQNQLKILQNKLENWETTTATYDLTVKEFSSEKNELSSQKSLEKCGLTSNMTIIGLNDLYPITQPTEFYSFFEKENDKIQAKQEKSLSFFPLNLRVLTPQGNEKILLCQLPIVIQKDALDRLKATIPFPVRFQSFPTTMPEVTVHAKNILDGMTKAFHALTGQMLLIYNGLKMLFSGSIPLSNLGGPLAVASIAGQAAKAGLLTFLLTMSLISVNIGIVNLLPLPALDGGALLLYLVEGFYGKTLPRSVQITVQKAGIFILIFLFVLVFYNDILRMLHS